MFKIPNLMLLNSSTRHRAWLFTIIASSTTKGVNKGPGMIHIPLANLFPIAEYVALFQKWISPLYSNSFVFDKQSSNKK